MKISGGYLGEKIKTKHIIQLNVTLKNMNFILIAMDIP